MRKNSGFYSLHLNTKLLETLDGLDFTDPTPIQSKAIPRALKGRDIIGLAQTGTGKTLAFALPMIQKIKNRGGKGLVLVPTRELAMQAAEAMEPFLSATGLYGVVLIGGASGSEQYKKLKENPDVIIATPGRLYEHLCQKNLVLDEAETFVLDEADRMFDMGFLPQVEKIMRFLPPVRQTLMFSATMPDEIAVLARENMVNPIRIEVSPQGTAPELVNQELYIVERGKKTELLGKLLDTYWGSVLLFVRTRYNAKKIAKLIRSFPHSVAELHSNRTMNQRKEALEGFKSGKYRILVATDIAARGIDVMGIELVINYDLPDEPENYVHRIGRTGRAGHPGHSITLAAPDQEFEIRAIEKLVRKKLTVVDLPDYTAEKFVKGTEARPKGEKRLPRREMAGSENDPVKKPRNIFAARRKAAAARKAAQAASRQEKNNFEEENYTEPSENQTEYISERSEFNADINENVQAPAGEGTVWGESEINAAMVETASKKSKNKKTAKKTGKSKKEKNKAKIKKSQKKDDFEKTENFEKKQERTGRRTAGYEQEGRRSHAVPSKKRRKAESAADYHSTEPYRDEDNPYMDFNYSDNPAVYPARHGNAKGGSRKGRSPIASRLGKDYKPPRRSLIMDSAYFEDDTPEKRYFDSRRPISRSTVSRDSRQKRGYGRSSAPKRGSNPFYGKKGFRQRNAVRQQSRPPRTSLRRYTRGKKQRGSRRR